MCVCPSVCYQCLGNTVFEDRSKNERKGEVGTCSFFNFLHVLFFFFVVFLLFILCLISPHPHSATAFPLSSYCIYSIFNIVLLKTVCYGTFTQMSAKRRCGFY